MYGMAGPEGILNFLPVSERLGTAGQPTREQLATLRAAGFEVVINLAMPGSPGWIEDEGDVLRAAGIRYYHIPVAWQQPQPADLNRFFELMDSHAHEKVFVHCAMNKRVSAFVFLYRVLRKGESPGQAAATLHCIWQPEPVWQRFIDESLAALRE
jgi:protein tyrosine phosphatase (PTP) superfamily phosphohydrolase (DUF442 family)